MPAIDPRVITSGVGSPDAIAYDIADLRRRLAQLEAVTGTVGNNAISGGAITPGSITGSEIASGTITATNIAAATITASQIATGTITATQMAALSISTNALQANAVTAAKIAAATITANEMAANSITATQLAANSVTASAILAGTIDSTKLNVSTLSSITSNMGSITAGTITGGTIQTGASGARTVMDTAGLRGYATDGVTKVFEINSGSGTASFTGVANILTGSTIVPTSIPLIGGGNLIPDSSFEDIDPTVFATTGVTAVKSTGQQKYGAQALAVTYASGVDPYAFYSLPFTDRTPALGQKVTFSAWVYVPSTVGAAVASTPDRSILIYDGVTSTSVPISTIPRNTWTRVSTTLSVNAAAASLSVRLYNIYATGNVYYDGVQLELGEVPTAYSPKANEILPFDMPLLGGGNLLSNSGFEDSTNLQLTVLNAPTTFATSTTQKHSGARSVQVTGGTTTSSVYRAGSAVPTPLQGNKYTFSFWYYGPATPISAQTSQAQPSPGASNQPGTVSTPPANTWTRFSVTRIVPAGETQTNLIVSVPAASQTYFIDDIQWEEGEVATSYAPLTSEILPGTVGTTELAALSVTAAKIAANTITASQIAANTITASQIAALTITANEIAANTITAAKIAANTITAAQIASGTITATQIATGAITANLVAAGAITTQKLAFSTAAGNLLQDSSFEFSGAEAQWVADSFGAYSILASSPLHGASVGRTTIGTANPSSYILQKTGTRVPVTPGNDYTMSVYVRNGQATASRACQLVYQMYDASGATVGAAAFVGTQTALPANTTTWTRVVGTIPGASITSTVATIRMQILFSATTGNLVVGETYHVDEAIFEPGSTAAVTYAPRDGELQPGSVGNTLITPDAVTTDKILAGTILGADIAASTITGGNIAAATITATHLTATAIDAMTITGATLRTSATNPKVQIDSTGLNAYDASGVNTINISSAGAITINGGAINFPVEAAAALVPSVPQAGYRHFDGIGGQQLGITTVMKYSTAGPPITVPPTTWKIDTVWPVSGQSISHAYHGTSDSTMGDGWARIHTQYHATTSSGVFVEAYAKRQGVGGFSAKIIDGNGDSDFVYADGVGGGGQGTPGSTTFTVNKAGVYLLIGFCTCFVNTANVMAQAGIGVDGNYITETQLYFNQASVHMEMNPGVWTQSLSAGTHTMSVRSDAWAVFDGQDRSSIIAIWISA